MDTYYGRRSDKKEEIFKLSKKKHRVKSANSQSITLLETDIQLSGQNSCRIPDNRYDQRRGYAAVETPTTSVNLIGITLNNNNNFDSGQNKPSKDVNLVTCWNCNQKRYYPNKYSQPLKPKN